MKKRMLKRRIAALEARLAAKADEVRLLRELIWEAERRMGLLMRLHCPEEPEA